MRKGKVAVSILLVLTSCAMAGCSLFTRKQAEPTYLGKLVLDEITSPALAGNLLGDPATRPVYVYLPPSYETSPQRRYPVVYLLHGFMLSHTGFTANGEPDVNDLGTAFEGADLQVDIVQIVRELLQAAQAQEMIIVLPNGFTRYGGSWWERSAVIGDYRAYVASDLVAYIDGKYRTVAERGSRAIAGHSMGGCGAMSLAIEHPSVFGVAAAMGPCEVERTPASAYLEAYLATHPAAAGSPVTGAWDGDVWSMIGGYEDNLLYARAAIWSPNANNPPFYVDLPVSYPAAVAPEPWAKWVEGDLAHQLARNGQNLANTAVFVSYGLGQGAVPEDADAPSLSHALDAAGVPYTLMTFPGDHITSVRAELAAALRFCSERFPHP